MSAPTVTLGVPVYNGATFLDAALESIHRQTFRDFEVIVSDNASTDETPRIVEGWVGRDERFQSFRQSANIGAAANFNAVLEPARGRFFKWVADDDLHEPTFLARCVERLDMERDAVVAHTDVRLIDDAGVTLGEEVGDLAGQNASRVAARFAGLITNDLCCYEVFGLIRTDVLRRTPGIAPFIASDRTLRAELGLHGRFARIPEPLFLSRDHAGRSTRAMEQHHLRGAWFAPTLAGRRVFPHWRILFEYARCVRRAPLSFRQRLACWAQLPRWVAIPRNLKWLGADLLIAADPRIWDLFKRWRGRPPEALL